MILVRLALQSIANRKLSTALTVLSIALSVALLIGVENVRRGARESFRGTVNGVDLIVGARTGPLQLLLYSVFHLGQATANIDWESYKRYREHQAVRWTIPISLGDGHRGFRVVATNENFYEHYRFRQDRQVEFRDGEQPRAVFDVALGSEVAEKLGYELGRKIVLNHGMAARGIMDHRDKPFTVKGILKRTGTPIDRSLYISLEGMEAIHVDWQSGAPPLPGDEVSAERILGGDVNLQPKNITAFFLRSESRILTLRLQREINQDEQEPLLAVIPGVTLGELWATVGYAEAALRIVSIAVVLVGLTGMLVSIYTSLNERRREMAILRALGAGPRTILFLFVLESGLLSAAGAVFGLVLVYGGLWFAQPMIEESTGLFLPISAPALLEYIYLGGVIVAGFLIGLVPAYRAYRNALVDGLSIRI